MSLAMTGANINSREQLRAWLNDKPVDWAQIIAARAALRVLPMVAQNRGEWFKPLSPIRSNAISWAARSVPDCDMARAAYAACHARDPGGNAASVAAMYAANAASHPANGVLAAVDATHAVEAADAAADADAWSCISADCSILDNPTDADPVRLLSAWPLWIEGAQDEFQIRTDQFADRLLKIDPNYAVWIDWYERRIRGERAAFDIPGDEARTEDEKILRRLAKATDEDFWDKGHEYVNATLKGWLDEARARAAPAQALPVGMATETSEALALPPLPPQEATAITYGVNEQGMLDRLPSSDQAHLRDLPDQRRAYADLRAAAAELLGEGQRLGHRLHRALDRFLHSLPDGFEDAEAYLIWRDANALRRLHRAHREAAKNPEPDEARLEPVVAEGLGGLLDLYNNFAFADDGLRAKDEARIAPQERASAEAEAKAAMPLIDAILANPEIATPEALDDIAAEAENAELPADDPYSAQVLQQSNECRKNFWAAALAWGAKTLASPKQVGKAVSIGLVTGAAGVVGKVAMTSIIGTDYGPLLPFIAANAEILQCYVAIAFQSFEHLPSLIDQLKSLWAQLRD